MVNRTLEAIEIVKNYRYDQADYEPEVIQ